MSRRLPPLNALRAFEAVARLGSFTRAAQALCVTQGATSRHVAGLESWLGIKLFERGRHAIRLTPQGQAYFDSIMGAFNQIEQSTRRLQADPQAHRLRIKLPPTFAIRWLMPRLARFHAAFPKLDVQITTSHQRVDFHAEDVDVGIHSEPRPPTADGFRRLFGETLVPVCSPSLLRGPLALARPGDLAGQVLLCSMNRPLDWPLWLAAAGVPHIDGNQGLKFENAALAYQAAANGLGVMIAVLAFVEDDLASGRLVAPLALPVRTEGAYYLSYPTDQPRPQQVLDFERWVGLEAGLTESLAADGQLTA